MEDLREKLTEIIRDCGDEYYLQETSPEKIADQILACVKEALPELAKWEVAVAEAVRILKVNGYVQLDPDQSLPKNPYAGDVAYYDTFREKKAFQVAIAAIRKAGCWRRVMEVK